MAASPNARAFFLSDARSGTQFLVDTGACCSLYPRSRINSPGPRGQDMRAAIGSRIATFGKSRISMHHNGRRYSWSFTIADMCFPILGADFLHHYDLMVDMKRQRLLQPATGASITGATDDYSLLKHCFRDVFQLQLRARKAPAKHHVKHFITTTGSPVYARFRRLAPDRLKAAKQCFQYMEKQGLCQKASSPWASPLHIVEKKDGTIRPCSDYRRLNNFTEADHYPRCSHIQQAGFNEGLLPGAYESRGHPENRHNNALRDLNFQLLLLRPQKRRGHLPAPHGRYPRRPTLLRVLCGQRPDLLGEQTTAPPAPSSRPRATQQKRPHRPRRQMHLRRHRHRVPGTQHLQTRSDSPSGEGRRRAEVPQAFHHQGPKRIPGLGYLLPPLSSTRRFHSGTTQRTPQGQTESSLLELRRRCRLPQRQTRPCQHHAALLSCSQRRTAPHHRRQRHRHWRSSRAATRRTNSKKLSNTK